MATLISSQFKIIAIILRLIGSILLVKYPCYFLTFTLMSLMFLFFDLIFIDKVENFSEEYEKNSHHIYKNAEDSTKKPNAETIVASGYKADEI